jgi:hypothetical protein
VLPFALYSVVAPDCVVMEAWDALALKVAVAAPVVRDHVRDHRGADARVDIRAGNQDIDASNIGAEIGSPDRNPSLAAGIQWQWLLHIAICGVAS